MIHSEMFSNKRSAEFFINPGTRIKETKHGVVGADGVIRLVKDGVIDIQDQMNSYAPSCSIYNIIAQLSPDEFNNLSAPAGDFVDATEMPSTYAEALQLVIDGQNAFMKLPLEVRQRFDNDFNKWFVSAGSPEWFQKCGISLDGVQPVESSDVVKEEVNSVES